MYKAYHNDAQSSPRVVVLKAHNSDSDIRKEVDQTRKYAEVTSNWMTGPLTAVIINLIRWKKSLFFWRDLIKRAEDALIVTVGSVAFRLKFYQIGGLVELC